MRCLFALLFLAGVVMTVAAPGSRAEPHQPQSEEDVHAILDSLRPIDDHLPLADGKARVELSPDFIALAPADARLFLTRVWGNPADAVATVQGLILPRGVSPLSEDAWAVVLSYEDPGHIGDSEAGTIDYGQLLHDMQVASEEGNKERTAAGYPAIHLIDWASPPYYDNASKKLHWAKHLNFVGDAVDTLNYEIRILGRTGFVRLNVVAPMTLLEPIRDKVGTLLAMVDFTPGNTYADFDQNVDETAAYGIAGLIAGGILTKAGFFKGLIALVIAFKKVFAIGAVAVVVAGYGAIRRVFGRRDDNGV